MTEQEQSHAWPRTWAALGALSGICPPNDIAAAARELAYAQSKGASAPQLHSPEVRCIRLRWPQATTIIVDGRVTRPLPEPAWNLSAAPGASRGWCAECSAPLTAEDARMHRSICADCYRTAIAALDLAAGK